MKTTLPAVVEVENMEFYAYHGCYDTEQRVGNTFLVTVRLTADLSEAIAGDDLEATLNYLEVYRIAGEEMEKTSRIIENVAGRIIDRLFITFPQLLEATVKVSKMNPPLGGKVERTSVTLTRRADR